MCTTSEGFQKKNQLQSEKVLLVGVQAAPQQGWDLSELAGRCSHAGHNQGSRGTAVPVLGCHRKARGQWCHIWGALQNQPGVGRCQNVLWDFTQKQVALAALQFVSLVCPQQLQRWDYQHPCLFPIVSAGGNPVWELPCPFLRPLNLSVSTPPMLTNCRSSPLFG